MPNIINLFSRIQTQWVTQLAWFLEILFITIMLLNPSLIELNNLMVYHRLQPKFKCIQQFSCAIEEVHCLPAARLFSIFSIYRIHIEINYKT